MLVVTVKPHGHDEDAATRTAAPSLQDPTRTSDPAAGSGRIERGVDARPLGVTTQRDPARYQVIGEHGRGGLGRVSRAYDRELGRDVAIKELLARGDVPEVRFLREALITARLEHPGIVTVHEAGRWPDGTPFYAMKLVSGRPLRALIAERPTVGERIGLLHHVIAVADAIAYAHGRNIIHRDLKPSNVIVGEFGETVVIDWGLAKDLSASEDPVVGDGSPRSSGDGDLTAAGSVLGTPAYMAPEQARGEAVDRRADVFAIGAMLWELCGPQRVPPDDARQRARVLRRAGIDDDLAAILDKALQPAPADRYADAGALAADLKAFKSGARIAARSYSLVALLAHWTRRHRAAAVSAAVALVVAAAAGTWFVRSLAVARDRADAALARTEAVKDELTLEHAELLLRTDPTAAFELMQDYQGRDAARRDMLRAKARGLGLARWHATPHARPIFLARPLEDGSVATLGADGRLVKVAPGGTGHTVADQASSLAIFGYAEARHAIAYACDRAAICMIDVASEQRLPTAPEMATFAPIALAVSPSGRLLSAVSSSGALAIWQLPDGGVPVVRYQAMFPGGRRLAFADDHALVVRAPDRVQIVHLDDDAQRTAASPELAIAEMSDADVSRGRPALAIGTARGEVVVIDTAADAIQTQKLLCKGTVAGVFAFADRAAVGYACHDGDAGIWDLASDGVTVVLHVDEGASAVVGSADGRYLVVGGGSGGLQIYDQTTHLAHALLGHTAAITELVAPSSRFPFVVSADASGALRTWALPDAAAWVAAARPGRLRKVSVLPDHAGLVAVGEDSVVTWSAFDGQTQRLTDHAAHHQRIAESATAPRLAMYRSDDQIELWSFRPPAAPGRRTLATGHGAVGGVEYTADGSRLIVGSRDGAVAAWSSDGASPRELGSIHEPVDFIYRIPRGDAVIVVGARGALWRVGAGEFRLLATEPEPITYAAVSEDARWIATGTAQGSVHVYDLATGQRPISLHRETTIEYVAFAPDSALLAIATKKGVTWLPVTPAVTPSRAPRAAPGMAWSEVSLPAGALAFSRDSQWLAILCDDDGVWLYQRTRDRWRYVATGGGHVSSGRFSGDSARLVATDTAGRALVIDLSAL